MHGASKVGRTMRKRHQPPHPRSPFLKQSHAEAFFGLHLLMPAKRALVKGFEFATLPFALYTISEGTSTVKACIIIKVVALDSL